MHQLLGDEPIRVTIEMPNGNTWSGKAYMASIDVDHDYHRFGDVPDFVGGIYSWTAELQGVGELTWTEREEFSKKIERERVAQEWRCDFCGGINPREYPRCSGCGAFRSFLYEN